MKKAQRRLGCSAVIMMWSALLAVGAQAAQFETCSAIKQDAQRLAFTTCWQNSLNPRHR